MEKYFEDIKRKMELAKEIVKDENDPFKIESFKIIFEKLIQSNQSEIQKNRVEEHDDKISSPLEYKKMELAKKCGLTLKELEDVFSIHEESIKIIVPINGNDSFKRLIASQCYLIAAETVLEKWWTESKELAEVMREIGVKDLGNLAPQLKKHSDIFRIDSKRGNSKYKLTSGLGRTKALDIIHKLAKGEPIEN